MIEGAVALHQEDRLTGPCVYTTTRRSAASVGGMSGAEGAAVAPTAFGEPRDESVVPGEQQQRKRLQLTSAASSVGMNASINRRVARGPDGTRGFDLKRSVKRSGVQRHDKPTKPSAVPPPAAPEQHEEEIQRQQQLGNQLYTIVSAIQPSLAGKITGMMLGYYDCAALAELLSDQNRVLETVDEAVRLLARAATTDSSKPVEAVQQNSGFSSSTSYLGEHRAQQPAPAEHEEILLPSAAEPHQPLPDTTTGGAARKAQGDMSEGEVEKFVRKHLFENADWPETYTEEDRQRLRCAVRKETSGESGLWIASVVLQVCTQAWQCRFLCCVVCRDYDEKMPLPLHCCLAIESDITSLGRIRPIADRRRQSPLDAAVRIRSEPLRRGCCEPLR